MFNPIFKYLINALVSLIILTNCANKKTEIVWTADFSRIGSQSSPRTADLTGDGVLDIVMGAGRNEFQHSKMGVIAMDGSTGDLLWTQETDDQVFGSATFYDINDDGVPDVFIGGRSPQLRALDGRTGAVIWSYKYLYEDDPVLRYARCNFYNSVLVPDQNDDGIPELLTVNGGNATVAPYVEEGRVPGVLLLFNSVNGHILAADTMPDGKESYMSPIYYEQPGESEGSILFGSGGETISGKLYLTKLSDFMNNDLSKALIMATEKGHGFIAPPVLADITDDGYYDIVAISHRSTVFAIDGRNWQHVWTNSIPDTECSNSFAVGYFNGDEVPDFFTFVSKGQWPDNTGSLQIMISGKDGRVGYDNAIGCTGFSSPVVYDLDRDGVDEAIISINEFDCSKGFTVNASTDIQNQLLYINFRDKSVNTIDQSRGFKNIFSTPWIGDIDGDKYLDIVHCQYFNPSSNMMQFMGMQVKRISLPIRMKKPLVWGAYMGSKGDGIFPM